MLDIHSTKPLIILEFANNHMGSYSLFKAMVDDFTLVAKDYTDFNFAIKLQYRDLDSFVHKNYKGSDHPGVKRFESTNVSFKEWSPRIDYAISKGFYVGCTPFDEVSVTEVLNDQRFSFLKIGSCSFNDWPFLEKIRKELTNKKNSINLIASTGGMPLDIIDDVVSFLSKSDNVDMALMHCIAQYPSMTENQNLSWINTLKERYQKIVGFSTHESGSEELSGAYAYCMGAMIFEKHVVSSSASTINAYSSNPIQVRKWLDKISTARSYIGNQDQRISEFSNEKKYLDGFRRGVYIRNKSKLSELSEDDVYVAFPRSENQLSANEWSRYKKYTLNEPLDKDQPINKEVINVENLRGKIHEIRNFVRNILSKSKIAVEKGARIEISHHYGLDHYDQTGMAMLTFVNNEYCKKIMIMKANQHHPEQYHKVKRETFILLFGEIDLTLDGIKHRLKPGNVITVDPGIVHSFTAVVDSVIEEISSTHHHDDSYYIDDKISLNKNRKSYISLYES